MPVSFARPPAVAILSALPAGCAHAGRTDDASPPVKISASLAFGADHRAQDLMESL